MFSTRNACFRFGEPPDNRRDEMLENLPHMIAGRTGLSLHNTPSHVSGFVVGPQIPRGTGTPVGPELRTPSHAAASLNLFYECCRRDRVHPQRLKACSP